LGVIGLFISGWLGGTLVYRNQIGVDPRYAHAGKWNEYTVQQERGAIEVADADELKVNQMKLIRLKNKRIVLGRTENGYVAFDDRCTHRGGSLAGGAMICGTVQCPWHGSQFSVTNGEVKAGPAKSTINTYTVSELNGKVLLTL
jgi:nitrite reductase/ring-hydroxylating ferredoxin subunit